MNLERVIALARRFRVYLALAGCLAAGLLVSAFYLTRIDATGGMPGAPLDDTYIHLQYARQLAHGEFFHYISGEAYTTGCSSPLYAILLSPLFLLGLGPAAATWTAFVLGALALGGTAFAAALVARRIAGTTRSGVAAAALVLASGPIVFNSLTGMETGVTCAALMIATALALRVQVDPERTGWFVGVLALLPLLRPEGLLFAGVLGLAAATWMWPRLGWRRTALRLLPAAVPAIGYYLTNIALTGDWVQAGARIKSITQNPYAIPGEAWAALLKVAWDRLPLVLGVRNRPVMLPLFMAPLVLLGLFGATLREERARLVSRRFVLGSIVVLGYLVLSNSRGNIHGWQRYFIPIFPPLMVAAALGVEALVRKIPHARAAAITGWVLQAAAAVLLAWQTHPLWIEYFAAESKEIRFKQVALAGDIRRLPQGEWIATMDVGATTLLGGRRVLDVNGLISPHTAEYAILEVPGRVEVLGAQPVEDRPRYAAFYVTSLPPVLVGRKLAQQRGFMLYELNWAPLDRARAPLGHDAAEIVDRLDIADPHSEEAHAYRFRPQRSEVWRFTKWAVHDLGGAPMVDAGRRVAGEQMTLAARPGRDAVLVVRTDGAVPRVTARWNDATIALAGATPAGDGWIELSAPIPAAAVRERNRVSLTWSPEQLSFHVFVLQR